MIRSLFTRWQRSRAALIAAIDAAETDKNGNVVWTSAMENLQMDLDRAEREEGTYIPPVADALDL